MNSYRNKCLSRQFSGDGFSRYTNRLIVAVLAALLLLHTTVSAQSPYPQRADRQINDYAGALADADKTTIHSAQTALLRERGAELVVVTINSVDDYDVPEQTIEAFATNLFNSWGIGDRQRNDGVLLLVAIKDRKVRIEVGSGYGDSYNSAMQGVIDEDILPRFRTGNYSQGIVNGVRGIRVVLTAAPSQSSTFVASPLVIAGVLVAGFALVLGTAQVALHRRRRWRNPPLRQVMMCGHCHRPMDELGIELVDADLDAGHRVERQLGSVHYQLWECRSCGSRKRQSQPGATLRYRSCPKCRYRTLEDDEQITQPPSHTRRGLKVTTRHCHYCGYTTVLRAYQLAARLLQTNNPQRHDIIALGVECSQRMMERRFTVTGSAAPALRG
jgi:uncharacterized protein